MRRSTVSSQVHSRIPWFLVLTGSAVFWTIALGVGLPSLSVLLGDGSGHRLSSASAERCVAPAMVDGRAVEFGDCINVHFMLDAPVPAQPPHVVPYQAPVGDDPFAKVLHRSHEDRPSATPDEQDAIGRTAY